MPPKEETEFYVKIGDGEYAPIDMGFDLTADTTGDVDPTVSTINEEFSFTVTTNDGIDLLVKTLLPRGWQNAEILKRDGYLAPSNGVME